MDAMEFFDINGDGKPELLVGQSDVGTLAYNAQNGEMLWQNISDHSQQITAGYILGDSKTPQVVTNGRIYGPARPVGGRPGLRPAGTRQEGRVRQVGAAVVEASAAGRRRLQVRLVWAAAACGAWLYWFDNQGRSAGDVAGASSERQPELCARRLVRHRQAHLLLVPLQAGAGWQRDPVLQGRGVPHVRLRPHRRGPGDYAGRRRSGGPGGGGTQICASTATPASHRTRSRATRSAANSSPTTRIIESAVADGFESYVGWLSGFSRAHLRNTRNHVRLYSSLPPQDSSLSLARPPLQAAVPAVIALYAAPTPPTPHALELNRWPANGASRWTATISASRRRWFAQRPARRPPTSPSPAFCRPRVTATTSPPRRSLSPRCRATWPGTSCRSTRRTPSRATSRCPISRSR